MKNRSLLIWVILILITILLGSCCSTRYVEYKSKTYVPVYKDLNEIRSGLKNSPPRDLMNTGKIYFYGNYILINEKNEGIHIIDNSNPSNPRNISFVNIQGNGDMAVKNNILYANSYVDLVALDISNTTSPTLVKRVNNIFPNLLEINNNAYLDPEKGLLVDFIEKDTVIKYSYRDCGDMVTSPVDSREFDNTGRDVSNDGAKGSAGSTGGVGKGGSMARFTIYDNYLYSVDRTSLQLFDIQNVSDPKVWSKVNIGWDIETIFPFRNRLFIGSTTGMFIYDVSTPWNPLLLSQFSHARACDPVVADDNYAYVTLRTGTRCGGAQNQLDILDISNLTSPKLIKSYPMQGPAGLGIDNGILFICDGPAGLKVFDAKNPNDIKLIDWKSDMIAFDVIPLGNTLLMIAEDGFYQYDYSNPKDLKLLSKIPVKK